MQDNLQQRLEFIGLGEDVETRLSPISALLEHHLETALQRFHARVATTPSAARFLYGRDRIETNGEGLAEHWRALVSGHFDSGFAETAQRMGQRHARIGLEPRWHVASYASLVETLIRGVIVDGMGLALQSRRGALGLFGGGENNRAIAAAEAIAEGLATLMAGVLLDIDLSVSGYVDKVREEGRNGVEVQRTRLRQAVRQAGAALELAAEGRKDAALMAATDPDLAPLHEGAEHLADRVLGLVEDLETSSVAVSTIAARLVENARSLRGAPGERVEACHGLADSLATQSAEAAQVGAALDALNRTARSLARRCAGGRKPADEARAALDALGAIQAEQAGLAEQLDAMTLKAQFVAARQARPDGEDEELRVLGTALSRLAGQCRARQARADGVLAELGGSVDSLAGLVETLGSALAASAKSAADIARTGRGQGARLGEAAASALALEKALAADEARTAAAEEGLEQAMAMAETLAGLARSMASETETEPVFPQHDQAALAAHWHAG